MCVCGCVWNACVYESRFVVMCVFCVCVYVGMCVCV